MPAGIQRVVTRIVVADRAEARFFDLVTRHSIRPVGQLSHPDSRLYDRDLKSDRPHDGNQTPREHEAGMFAHEISATLGRDHAARRFERLMLVASPTFLGTLRSVLPKGLREAVVAEVPKDLVHESEHALKSRLPEMLNR
jgi:protein required for attachment to host cells